MLRSKADQNGSEDQKSTGNPLSMDDFFSMKSNNPKSTALTRLALASSCGLKGMANPYCRLFECVW